MVRRSAVCTHLAVARGVRQPLVRPALVEIARAADGELVVFAQTLPEHGPSPHLLKGLGFTLRGTVHHPEDGDVWEWQLAPPARG